MTTNKKERVHVREVMNKSLTAKPSRQAEIAEMMKGRLAADERKPEEKAEESPARAQRCSEDTFAK